MKVAMIGISSKPSKALFSHNGGWTYVLLNILENFYNNVEIQTDPCNIHDYDLICINEGLNYKKGSWNFFGGVQNYTIEMLSEISKYKGRLISFNEEIDWPSLLKRKELKAFKIDDFKKVDKILTNFKTDKIIIGDSHSVSIYQPGYAISRNDGATLFGSLKQDGRLQNYNLNGYKNVVLYFGNIDIRFHIHRNGGYKAIDKLIKSYINYIIKINKGRQITIQGLLPIEDESRKLPGTGLYKGKAFYGTKEQRQSYVDYFNDQIEYYSNKIGFNFRKWNLPLDGFKEPKFNCLEARQSVHIRPEFYMFKDDIIKQETLKLF